MVERLKRLYDSGALSKDGVKKAVNKGLITEADYERIVGEKLK